MLVDGNSIAADIQEELKKRLAGQALRLVVVEVGSHPASGAFIERKRRFGEGIGVAIDVRRFAEDITENMLAAEIEMFATNPAIHGIVVQLPLPVHIETQIILDLVRRIKDPDALSRHPLVLAPVAGAVAEILKRCDIDVHGKQAVVIGNGRLVGRPVAAWLEQVGAEVLILNRDSALDMKPLTLEADIIVAGAGVPGLLTPDMIKEGVVLIDAGTSEAAGKLAGDIDPACAEKASLYTPVPGGVGPVTVAKLFENLIFLAERKNE